MRAAAGPRPRCHRLLTPTLPCLPHLQYTQMFTQAGSRRCAAKYRYVGRVVEYLGVQAMKPTRRSREVDVLLVRARWPQVVDFEKGEFVDGVEEEVLQLWPANYGCANKHNQWVVYDGKTGDELAAEANRDVVDLTLEEKMDDARRVAEALCAPATLA